MRTVKENITHYMRSSIVRLLGSNNTVVLKLRRGDATTGNGIWECREIEKDRKKELRETGHLNEHCNGFIPCSLIRWL